VTIVSIIYTIDHKFSVRLLTVSPAVLLTACVCVQVVALKQALKLSIATITACLSLVDASLCGQLAALFASV
jgi:hypothetical protein